MNVMRFVTGLFNTAIALLLLSVWIAGVTYAQTARKFGDKVPIVRLCPTTCVAVNGHGFKAGAAITVFETKDGWARVSAYLKRADLIKSFGKTITRKPALWVPVAQLEGSVKKTENTPKEPARKKASTANRGARLSKVPLPTFRPGTIIQAKATTTEEEAPVQTSETATETSDPLREEESATQIVENDDNQVEVVESQPAAETPQEDGTRRVLTWEELQAKLAEQEKNSTSRTQVDEKALDKSRIAEEKRRREAKARQQEKATKKTAVDAAKAEKAKKAAADAAKAEKAKKAAADAAKAEKAKKAAADAAKAEKAKKAAADAAKAEKAKKIAADAAKAEKAKKVAADAAKAEKAKKADAEAAKAKKVAAKAEKANQAAKDVAEPKKKGVVEYTPPKAKEEQVAVVKPKKPPGPEPTYSSAEADPIVFGTRPKKLTKALLDKRLKKLPGRKSRVKKEVVIALRHYALGLLNSGECKGISRGGASAVPGMLYIACSDDPTYLRQFPLVEESW